VEGTVYATLVTANKKPALIMVLDIFALIVIVVLVAAIIASQRSVDLSQDQYEAGLVDYQRVLNSQASLLSQQDALADAQGRIATSLVSTYRALGGGWQLREGHSVVRPSTLDTMRERTDWGELLDE
jgi:Na+-transporting NADH:ubiquinone oxidoreductase subunit NqrC